MFEELTARYGRAAAELVWRASESGDSGAVADAIAEVHKWPVRSESTWGLFGRQIVTDPFAVPLESANRGIGVVLGSAIKGLFKNPWVLLVVVLVLAVWLWPLLRPLVGRVLKRP
jgi:hypothetical protein